MSARLVPFAVIAMMTVGVSSAPGRLEMISDNVVAAHMADKQIPGLSIAIVQQGELVFAKGYGMQSIEFERPADADAVYPISSVSRIIAGVLAMRLAKVGKLDLDASIDQFINDVPDEKKAITVRHLLQHTHGLEDFYRSDAYRVENGKSEKESTTDELVRWVLDRPLQSAPGDRWAYGVAGYVILGRIFEQAGGATYDSLVNTHVFAPLGINAQYGDTTVIVPGRNPILYELVDNAVDGHVIDFPERVWPAGGLNISVNELAKLFIALSGSRFLNVAEKFVLWNNETLADGSNSNYGLGWHSYVTSRNRWVVGHEGGGASWVVYYPEQDLAIIALSNMSMARADMLPYEIARAMFGD